MLDLYKKKLFIYLKKTNINIYSTDLNSRVISADYCLNLKKPVIGVFNSVSPNMNLLGVYCYYYCFPSWFQFSSDLLCLLLCYFNREMLKLRVIFRYL